MMLDAGVAVAMIELLKNQTRTEWLDEDQHHFCIHYAVSILGSALHGRLPQRYFEDVLEQGLLDVLLPLLAGSASWLEARLGMRVVMHLCAGGEHVVDAMVAAGLMPVIVHFAEHLLPAAVREDVVKPHRGAHWHHDILCQTREGEFRKQIWKEVERGETILGQTVDMLVGRSAAARRAMTEPGATRMLALWLVCDPLRGNGGVSALTHSCLREGALEMLKTMFDAFPLMRGEQRLPRGAGEMRLVPVGKHCNSDDRAHGLEFPAHIVPPEDAEEAKLLACRVVDAGLHRLLVVLGHCNSGATRAGTQTFTHFVMPWAQEFGARNGVLDSNYRHLV